MLFEQGVATSVNAVVIMIIIISLVILTILFLKTRNFNLFWYIASMIFASIAYYFLRNLLFVERDVPQPMVSEENTIILSICIFFWIISMLVMWIGFWKNFMAKKN